jgi:hypothetical protein
MNIRYNIVVVAAEDNLSCHCVTQQDAHHENGCHRYLARLRLLLFRWTASERRREGDTWCSKVGEHPPRCSFGRSLRCLLLQPFLHVCAAPIIGGMGFSPPPTGSYRKLECKQRSLFPDTLCAGGRPRTTNNGEVAYSLPKRGRTHGSCGTAYGRSDPCMPLPWLLCGKGLSSGRSLRSLPF